MSNTLTNPGQSQISVLLEDGEGNEAQIDIAAGGVSQAIEDEVLSHSAEAQALITAGKLTASGTVPTLAAAGLPANPIFNKLITYLRSLNTKVIVGASTQSGTHGATGVSVTMSVQSAASVINIFDNLTQVTFLLDATDAGSGTPAINGTTITKSVGVAVPVVNGVATAILTNTTAEARVIKGTASGLTGSGTDTVTFG